ncbi:hypothetical protein D3C76_1074640 [compost metagenome]
MERNSSSAFFNSSGFWLSGLKPRYCRAAGSISVGESRKETPHSFNLAMFSGLNTRSQELTGASAPSTAFTFSAL